MNKEELKELAATLNGIADGKAWECMWGEGFDNPCGRDVDYCLKMRIPIRLKPWSLPPPPDGMQWHRDDWTKEMLDGGWRPLLRGEPRVLGDEFLFDQYERLSEWIDCNGPPATPNNPDSAWCHHRTKRPLPPPDPAAELKAAHAAGKKLQCKMKLSDAWLDFPGDFSNLDSRYEVRIKPEQQKVPLGSSDVPPGSAFTATDTLGYCCPVVVDEDGCYFASRDDGQDKIVSWEAMADGWQINRSLPLTGKWNPEAWEPCYKLIDTP